MTSTQDFDVSDTPATDEQIQGLPIISEYITWLSKLIDDVYIKQEDVFIRGKRAADAVDAPITQQGLPNDGYKMPAYVAGQNAWNSDNHITDAEGIKMLSHMSLFDIDAINVVHQRAQKYFYQNILYYTNEGLLALFNIKCPELTATRLEMLENYEVKLWYYGFSEAYFALALAESGSSLATYVNVPAVEKSMTELMTKFNTKALFDYAFVQKNRWMEMFLKDERTGGARRWAKVYAKYLKTAPYLDDFFAWHHDKTSRVVYHSALQNIKATCDVLDPSTNTSNDIIFYLNYMTVYYYMADKFQPTNVNKKVISETLARAFNKAKTPGSGSEPVVRDFIGAFANLNAALTEFQNAILYVQYESVGRPNIKNGVLPFCEAYGNLIIARLKIKLPNFVFTQSFKLFTVMMFRVCHVTMMYYAIVNHDKLDTFQKGYFAAEGVGALIDTAVAVGDKAGTDFINMSCQWFKLRLLRYTPAEFAQRVTTGFKWLFTSDASAFILDRFTPVMLTVSAIKAFYDIVQDLREGDIASLAMDGVTFGIAAESVAVFIEGVSWSGPFALGAGVALALVGGIKYFITSKDNPDKRYYNNFLPPQFKLVDPGVEI
eukprot:gene2629-3024_t